MKPLGIVVVVVVGFLTVFYFAFGRQFFGTSEANRQGAQIYARLQQVEQDVRAGKVKDPNDPELGTLEKQIDQYQEAHEQASFNDNMLYADLGTYASMLGPMATMDPQDEKEREARQKVEHSLEVEKKEIDGYLSHRFKIQ
jgi:hypothetical protein